MIMSNLRNQSGFRPISGFVPKSPPVTGDSIKTVLAAHSIVVVHFWAVWNGADPPMDEQLETVAKRLPFKIHFVSCDVDDPECSTLRQDLEITNVSFCAIYVNGEFRSGIMGLVATDELILRLIEAVRHQRNQSTWWRFW